MSSERGGINVGFRLIFVLIFFANQKINAPWAYTPDIIQAGVPRDILPAKNQS
jgi:hypothetical protein